MWLDCKENTKTIPWVKSTVATSTNQSMSMILPLRQRKKINTEPSL